MMKRRRTLVGVLSLVVTASMLMTGCDEDALREAYERGEIQVSEDGTITFNEKEVEGVLGNEKQGFSDATPTPTQSPQGDPTGEQVSDQMTPKVSPTENTQKQEQEPKQGKSENKPALIVPITTPSQQQQQQQPQQQSQEITGSHESDENEDEEPEEKPTSKKEKQSPKTGSDEGTKGNKTVTEQGSTPVNDDNKQDESKDKFGDESRETVEEQSPNEDNKQESEQEDKQADKQESRQEDERVDERVDDGSDTGSVTFPQPQIEQPEECEGVHTIYRPHISVAYKPVIYLYGYDEKVTVNLELEGGEFTCTYPEYSKTRGWEVDAKPDGTLTYKKRDYNYLYWEGTTDAEYTFDKGFCVTGAGTAEFLENKLGELGLNSREINEFIVYWLPQMQGNKFNVISFQTKTYTDKAKLTVTPEPNAKIRVFMAWYPSDKKVELEEQKFKSPARTGKVLVEWGGTKVDSHGKAVANATNSVKTSQQKAEERQAAQAAKQAEAEKKRQEAAAQRELQKQQQAAAAAATGKTVTDKNGTTHTFTMAEWNKLKSVWGGSEELVMHHTIAELLNVLKYN